jgi:hypothetical protein
MKLQSQWQAPATQLGEADWASLLGVERDGISFKAINDGRYLTIRLETASREVKSQLSGAFGQTISLWFDPSRQKAKTDGLSLELFPDRGSGFPHLLDAETDYILSASRVLSLLWLGKSGYPRALNADSPEASVSMAMSGETLVLQFNVPLRPPFPGAFFLDGQGGHGIQLGLASSKISPNLASEELERERETRDSEQHSAGPGGGGRHHHGAGMGGGLGGQEIQSAPSVPGQFEIWATLTLAAAPHP